MMQQFNSGGPTTGFEKVLRFLIPVGLIFGAVKLFNWIAPTLILLFTNVWMVLLIGGPLFLIAGFLIMNWKMLIMWYLGFCKKIARAFVKIDPLSIMDGYLETLRRKFTNLKKILLTLEGKWKEVDMRIADLQKSYGKHIQMAEEAKRQGVIDRAQVFARKAIADKESIDLFTPTRDRYAKNCKFMRVLEENWGNAIESLGYEIDQKRRDFEFFSSLHKGLKTAEEFIKADSAEAQAYGMSIQALQETMAEKLAYIEDFERKAAPIMTDMGIEKQAKANEALQLLEGLLKEDQLKLPTDFSVTNGMKKMSQDVDIISESRNKYNL